MMKLSISCAITALLATTGVASAQFTSPGDILFTTDNGGSIRNISGFAPGGSLTLWTATEFADTELAGIDLGPNGNFYVADGRNPIPGPDIVNSGIIEVTDLFGTPSSSYITRGNPLQRPIGLKYDATTDRLLTISNPGTTNPELFPRIDGIFSVTTDGSTVDPVFIEAAANPRPRFQAGSYLTPDPNSNDWWAASTNGGQDSGPPPNIRASTINRLQFNPGTNDYTLESSPSTIDLSASATGAPVTYNDLRGIAALPGDNGGTDLFFTDATQNVVVLLELDASDNLISLTEIASGFQGIGTLEYNPFSNQLVFVDDDITDDSKRVWSMNLDGSGLTLLHDTEPDQDIRGLYIIPAPGTMALLGLTGLAAVRRRR
jgi:uncharacterized protein (TIGR03382 family)